jgi:hypothetical protein
MTALANRTIEKATLSSFQQATARRGQRVESPPIDPYDNFIWALAKTFTASNEEAEAATKEIFIDIWQYATNRDEAQTAEDLLVALIARRRLMRCLQ